MDVEQLVMESKKGNIESFVELLSEKQEMFYKIAYTYSGNSYDAEDCLSEASIKAFNKIKQLREPNKFYKWFTTLLINLCRTRYKKQQRELENLGNNFKNELLADIIPDFSQNIEDKILVEKMLQGLEHDERNLLVLKFMQDFTIKEIA